MTAMDSWDDWTDGWPRRLVWLAAFTPVPPLVWMSVHHPGWALAVSVLLPVAALPNLALRSRSFVVACLAIGCALIVVGLCGIMFGLVAYAPAGVVLLLCPLADPRRRGVVGRVVAAVALVAVLVTVVGWSAAIYSSTLR